MSSSHQMLTRLYLAMVTGVTCLTLSFAEETSLDAADWRGFTKQAFTLKGRSSFVVEPKIAAPGMPWVWRTSFPNFHAEVDEELLHLGYHVGYIDCVAMLGSDEALDLMDAFYEHVRERWQLAARPALEAVSRGGLHAYRYAARHPSRIAAIYADTPVMDLKSWPLGWPPSKAQVAEALQHYGLADEAALRAYEGNPLDLLPRIARAKIPLRHVISLDDVVVPPEANTLEAQRRLKALGHAMEVVSVPSGYPAQHGHHFDLPDVYGSVQFIKRHTHVLPRNHEYFELRRGLGNSHDAFVRTGKGRIAFLGGSITHNPGWRDEMVRYFTKRFPDTSFEFIAAGIPSMGSVPHAFRLEADVLSKGPIDLLFVEAAVNDATNIPQHPEWMLRGMEGVVRHAREVNPLTDIVHLHFVMPAHMEAYRKGDIPVAVAQHERVAEAYGNPSLDLAREVTERIDAGEFTWKEDFKDLHPSPYGQRVYANSMMRLLESAFRQPTSAAKHPMPDAMLDPRSYSQARFGSIQDAKDLTGFRLDPSWTPADKKGTREGFVRVPALVATEADAHFCYDFHGRGIGLLITSGPDAGVIAFRIDDGEERTLDTITQWSGRLHLPWALILDDDLAPGAHTLAVRTTAEAADRTALRIFQFLVNGGNS